MNQISNEHVIDVRSVPIQQRHTAIFNAWRRALMGESILLVNDHDPLPLYHQFACEYPEEFRWEYVEKGPAIWRVRVTKGTFADPGFVPERKAPSIEAQPIGCGEPAVLDTRPIFERGETPCQAIDQAMDQLVPGQSLVLLVPFEPVPLYAKFGKQGFSHSARRLDNGTWRIEFRKAGVGNPTR